MLELVTALLACPACHGALRWQVFERVGPQIEAGDAACAACGAVYPVREGIGLFLPPGDRRADAWEALDSGLSQYLRAHPAVEHALLEGPLDALAPADQFFRGLVLDERGRFAEAQAALAAARPRVYTPESLACRDRHFAALIERLRGSATPEAPVVDIASGRLQLVERLARELARPIVATDLSPHVLRQDRRRLAFWGLAERVSLLAADARRTPFRTAAVGTLTSYSGLENVEAPAAVVRELRRVVRPATGQFLTTISTAAGAGGEVAPAAGGQTFPRPEALDWFAAAGWRVDLAEPCIARVAPTPVGVLVEGARIDAYPEAPAIACAYLLIASAP